MADIQGMDELLRGLADVDSLVKQKNIIARTLRKAAEPIRARAEELAPDDPTTPGSRIKENMMVTVSDQTAEGAVAKIGPSRKGFFGQFAEFGTAHQPAEPFLRPAFDEKLEEATGIIREELRDQIERAARTR